MDTRAVILTSKAPPALGVFSRQTLTRGDMDHRLGVLSGDGPGGAAR